MIGLHTFIRNFLIFTVTKVAFVFQTKFRFVYFFLTALLDWLIKVELLVEKVAFFNAI